MTTNGDNEDIECVPLGRGYYAIYETGQVEEEEETSEESSSSSSPTTASFPIPRNVLRWFKKDE